MIIVALNLVSDSVELEVVFAMDYISAEPKRSCEAFECESAVKP